MLTNKVYSKAFTNALGHSMIDELDDAETVSDIEMGPKELLPSTKGTTSINPIPTLPTRQFAFPSQSFHAAKSKLHVADIYTLVKVNHVAKDLQELTLEKDTAIWQLRRADERWC